MTQTAVLEIFQSDLETKVVVTLGEVGRTMELEAAEHIKDYITKPVVSLIVGRFTPEGAQMGHAGAIIEGKEGTTTNKINTLQKVGVRIA